MAPAGRSSVSAPTWATARPRSRSALDAARGARLPRHAAQLALADRAGGRTAAGLVPERGGGRGDRARRPRRCSRRASPPSARWGACARRGTGRARSTSTSSSSARRARDGPGARAPPPAAARAALRARAARRDRARRCVHPVLGLTVAELLDRCPDTSAVRRLARREAPPDGLPLRRGRGRRSGSGKTTVVERLAERLDANKVLEDWSTNPFLQPVLRRQAPGPPSRPSCSSCSRATGSSRSWCSGSCSPRRRCVDYVFEKSRLFAYLNLDDSELLIYEKLFSLLAESVPRPDLVVYLQAPTEVLDEAGEGARPAGGEPALGGVPRPR